ncbi:hypothetical protein J6590_008444 [Homalodisca vitripennis]|nr:hypothetical protein J6590_008444 [Homalodisca vitripennis]
MSIIDHSLEKLLLRKKSIDTRTLTSPEVLPQRSSLSDCPTQPNHSCRPDYRGCRLVVLITTTCCFLDPQIVVTSQGRLLFSPS